MLSSLARRSYAAFRHRLPCSFFMRAMAPVETVPVRDDCIRPEMATKYGAFKLLYSDKANGTIPVHKYRSEATGLTVVLAEVDGPVVNGYFSLATEANDDDGLPHTLEHLIFLGSEDYPYKGVLDLLANRCLASGTNAWTDTDHTCYTVTTAGSDGFLDLLPIYVDHILHPTLTPAGFTTEVHHIDGSGEDAGVVYCEMQGRENSGESLTHLAMNRYLYPGVCGYKSETGGIMKNLRESTTHEKVVKYHRDFYRSENLWLIITGQVPAAGVFKALESVEAKITAKGDRGPFTKPWQNPVPPVEGTQDIEILYPCDEEDHGMVHVAVRGPSATKDIFGMSAVTILMEYLTDTSASPLHKEFIDIDDPYASRVSYNLTENSETALYISFQNVPVSKIDSIADKLNDVLTSLGDIDMKRMADVIRKKTLEQFSQLENHPHETVAFAMIGDMLYGNNPKDFHDRLNNVEQLKQMETLSQKDWQDMLKKYLLENHKVIIRGKPSRARREQMENEEETRIDAQRESLGPEGCKKKEEELEAAIKINEIPFPDDMVSCVPIPTTSSICFHPQRSFYTESQEKHPQYDIDSLPFYIRLDNVKSNFVYLVAMMNTHSVPFELKRYLPLLAECFLESPVQRGSELIPHEQVVAELAANTVRAAFKLGVDGCSTVSSGGSGFSCGSYAQTAMMVLQVEPEMYERGTLWLQELLQNTRFTAERVKVLAAKMANQVSQNRRHGSAVTHSLMRDLCFTKDSNHFNSSMFRQLKFLTSIGEKLDTDKSVEVMENLEKVRKHLLQRDGFTMHIGADLDHLAKLVKEPVKVLQQNVVPILGLTGNEENLEKTIKVTPEYTLLTKEEDSVGTVAGLGCIESAFLTQNIPSLTDYEHPDFAALLTCLQYMTQLEGPMWRQIRGQGLSYGYSLDVRPHEGLLYMGLYKSANVVSAYREAKRVVQSHLNGSEPWRESLLQTARSSLIFELIEGEKSIGDVVGRSLISVFRGLDNAYHRKLLDLVNAITIDDMQRVGTKYLKPLFEDNGKTSRMCVVCHISKVQEIASGFETMGHKLNITTSLDESQAGQW